jgi:4-amino-4-deoxy-L-arabinose transferase-like glycosyltransferase
MSGSNSAPILVADNDPGVTQRRGFGRFVPIAAAFAIAFAILSLGITAPFQRDAESQSAQWVVDIVQRGNWLLPLDYYDLVERKPPLFYWLGAIGVKLSGDKVDEARARMPSLCAGAAVSALVMDWAAADLGTAAGWLAFFFLLGMYGFAARATVALTDMLMTFFLMAEWRVIGAQLEGAISWPRTISAGFILGLGILVKGPVIAVLVALATVLYFAMSRENPLRLATRAWPWACLVIALAVAAVWYVPALIAGRANDWGGVFVDENFGHFLPARMGGTGEAARPFYYIVIRLLGGTMPLSFLLAALALAFAQRAFALSIRRAMFYQIAMVLAVVILFSASSAKRDDYILPAIPPLAILFAALFSDAFAAPDASVNVPGRDAAHARFIPRVPIVRDLTGVAIAVVMLLAVVATICFARTGGSLDSFGAHLNSSDGSFAAIFLRGMTHLRPRFVVFVTAVVIGATVAISGFARRTPMRTGAGLAILCLAGTTLWTGVLKPQMTRTRSLGPFADAVKARVGAAPLYLGFIDPEFAWYYGRGVPALPQSIAIAGPDTNEPIYFVARPGELVRLSPPIRHALILVLPSSVLGGNPPSLYMLGSPESPPNQLPSRRHSHLTHSGERPLSVPPPPHLNGKAPLDINEPSIR